ncbi:MAG: hypothetical protein E7260_09655 [Lachnospiraceae bacterium]|nr:hypothetical protein [Lachnospiraceae bacterium]
MANALEYAQVVAQKKAYLKGASAEQKKAINYFIPETGCKGLFGKVKDEDYDAVVKAAVDASNSYKRALDKIGLDESELKEIPPVTLYGYEDSACSKTTAAGAYRSNLYSITHLFFSATQVYMYQLIINTMKNEKKERTEEYFYKDITNFSTSSDTIESLQFKGCSGAPKRVSVEIQKFALIVPGDKFSCATYGDIDQQVKAMKNKLREKKQ